MAEEIKKVSAEKGALESIPSWKPVRILEVATPFLDTKKFKYRFATDTMVGRITQLEAQGWIVDHAVGERVSKTLREKSLGASGNDTTYKVNQLILMKIPIELAKERNEFFQNQASKLVSAATDELEETAKRMGVRTYGSKVVETRHE